MKAILFSMIGLIFVVSPQATFAGKCATREDKKWITFVRGARDAKNSPTLTELFDALNFSSEFFDLQRGSEEKISPIEIYLEKVEKERKVWFDSVPQKRLNDVACGAPQAPPITGYQCRVNQYRRDPDFKKLPDGLDSKVIIRIPADRPDLLSQVMTAMSCGGEADEVVDDHAVRPVPAAPARAASAPTKH